MRDQIVVKAEQLFGRFGLAKTTVTDIASAVGMSSSNIYNLFPDKTAIIEAVGERLYLRIRDSVTKIVDSHRDPWAKFEAIILSVHHQLREQLQNEPEIMRLVAAVEANEWGFVQHFDDFLLDTLTKTFASETKDRLDLIMSSADTARCLMDCLAFATNVVFIADLEANEHERRVRIQLTLLKRTLS